MKGRPIKPAKAFLRVICMENGDPRLNRGANTKVLFIRMMEDGKEDVIDLTKGVEHLVRLLEGGEPSVPKSS